MVGYLDGSGLDLGGGAGGGSAGGDGGGRDAGRSRTMGMGMR